MNRRQFLGMSAAATGVLLGPLSLSSARRNLGIGARRSVAVDPLPARARTVDGRVDDVDGTVVTVALDRPTRRADVDLTVTRRGYPAGDIHETVDVGPEAVSGRRHVTVEIPRNNRESGSWFYEICAVEDGERRFVCESRPYRWVGEGDRTAQVGRSAPAKPSRRTHSFRRRLEDDEYTLAFRSWDTSGERVVHYRIRRSVHEAAVERERGYVRTFRESLSNPVAYDLASTITNVHRTSGDGSRRRKRDPTRDELFVRFVRFAQAIEYARDFDTTDDYDYNRTVEETLVDGTGDCKDKSHLLAGLLAAPPMECETALLFQPAHALLGVASADVPPEFADLETVTLGGREFLPVDPSLWFDIGDYPDAPITAAYGDDGWFHVDAAALGRGLDRNLRDWLTNGAKRMASIRD